MTASRSYRGVPAEQRRADRRAALIEAALDCLHDGGLAAVGVRAVCTRAKLTPRYFYENFVDIDELLVAAVDAAGDEVVRRSVSAIAEAGADTEAQVRAAVAAGLSVVADDPRYASAFLVAASGHGAMRERRHDIVERFAGVALANLGAMRAHAGREHTVALFVMGGTMDVIEGVLSERLELTTAETVDQLTALWLAVLQD